MRKVDAPKYLQGRAWHFCLQILCIAQRIPHLRLTDAAKTKLLTHMSHITEYTPVASLMRASDVVVGGVSSGPQWGIGFYNIATRPYGRVTSIQGVPFVFVQPRAFRLLNGATLDFRNGRFVVDGSAYDTNPH